MALLLLLAGCATVPRTPGERRDEDIETLKARVLELSERAAVQDVELGRLRQQVAALEARLAAAPPRTASSPHGRAADAAAAAAAHPGTTSRSGRQATVEESELADEPPAPVRVVPAAGAHPAPALSARSEQAPGSTATSHASGGGRENPPAVPEPQHAAPATPSAIVRPTTVVAEETEVPRQAQAVYDEAYTLYHQGHYEQAEARFEEFLAQAPDTELSDNAQYWIGAARFERHDYKGALASFRRTVERYPGGNKVPDALFKMGQTLEQLGQVGQALSVYDELVKRFPETAAATLATERLGKLRH